MTPCGHPITPRVAAAVTTPAAAPAHRQPVRGRAAELPRFQQLQPDALQARTRRNESCVTRIVVKVPGPEKMIPLEAKLEVNERETS